MNECAELQAELRSARAHIRELQATLERVGRELDLERSAHRALVEDIVRRENLLDEINERMAPYA